MSLCCSFVNPPVARSLRDMTLHDNRKQETDCVTTVEWFIAAFKLRYAIISGIYLSACRVSRGLLGGIEQAYMKGAFNTAAIAVFSTCTVHVIFFHSLPSRVGCSFQDKLFSIFKLLCLVVVSCYLSSRTALENCVLFVTALRSS